MSRQLVTFVLIAFLTALLLVPSVDSAYGDFVIYNKWSPLYKNNDKNLQNRLYARLSKYPQWERLIRKNKMAVGIVDLNGDHPRFASVNGYTMMYAASLPKIAILLGAIYSFEDGSLTETDEIIKDLKDMIAVSSNEAATRMMELIGIEKINRILQSPDLLFYDRYRGGGLWVGKPYAKNTVRIGDPLYNISHGATVNQVCRFYYLLATGRIINEQRSLQMLDILKTPLIYHKFVYELNQRAPSARVYRKSGTWKTWHADSVLVRGTQWRNYILVALVESNNGEKIIRELLPEIENILHPEM